MSRLFKLGALWVSAALACVTCLPAHSAAVIVNGGFEAGFNGWTRVDQIGSEGAFFLQSGATSPVSGLPVPPSPQGAFTAMTDAEGPGSHVLFQDFAVTAPTTPTFLNFDLFIGNRAVAFFSPHTLDFSTAELNQQARVDILAGGTDPFSLSAADVLLNVLQTQTGDPLVVGYTHHSIDVTALINAHLNESLRLRFAEVDNVFLFQFGVDNVSFTAAPTGAVPEPSSYLLAMSAVAALILARRRPLRLPSKC